MTQFLGFGILFLSVLGGVLILPSLTQTGSTPPTSPSWAIEAIGLIAGFGTTFAAFPDLITMVRKRSAKGMNPRMAGISASFQCLWLLYGWLLPSLSLILWNIVAILINTATVIAYFHFARLEK